MKREGTIIWLKWKKSRFSNKLSKLPKNIIIQRDSNVYWKKEPFSLSHITQFAHQGARKRSLNMLLSVTHGCI